MKRIGFALAMASCLLAGPAPEKNPSAPRNKPGVLSPNDKLD